MRPPNDPLFARAVALHNAGKLDEALTVYDMVLAGPIGSDPFVQFAVGSAMAQVNRYGFAIDLLKRSCEQQPGNHEAWSNLGLSYRTVGRVADGIVCHEKALALPMSKDSKAATLANLSGCYINEGEPQRALDYAEQGLALKDLAQLHNHRALALLELGRYDEGFAEYEQRFRLPEFTTREYPGGVGRWKGEDTERLALHGEQGLGDEILFLTGLKRVRERVTGEIHVECATRLVGLLRHSFKHDPKMFFYPDHAALMREVKPTAWAAMGSIYHITGGWTRNAYLTSSRKVLRGEKKRVGLSWRGGTMKTHEYYRNAPLDIWRVLVDAIKAEGAEAISLQYGPAQEMADELGVVHDQQAIADLDTLTGLTQSCDIVVSVCTTAIHLAGATGTPCLVLVPSKPAWRYGTSGGHSDWYDSVAYERQKPGEAWSLVMMRAVPRVQAFLRGEAL